MSRVKVSKTDKISWSSWEKRNLLSWLHQHRGMSWKEKSRAYFRLFRVKRTGEALRCKQNYLLRNSPSMQESLSETRARREEARNSQFDLCAGASGGFRTPALDKRLAYNQETTRFYNAAATNFGIQNIATCFISPEVCTSYGSCYENATERCVLVILNAYPYTQLNGHHPIRRARSN
ncbi:hypothetical protein PENANT_c177G03441, partial [Penicillium antarcticum]